MKSENGVGHVKPRRRLSSRYEVSGASERDVSHSIVICIIIINSITRVASHLARSDKPSITCIVAQLSCSDTPRPSDQLQGSTRATRELPQDLHAKFNFTHLKLAVTFKKMNQKNTKKISDS